VEWHDYPYQCALNKSEEILLSTTFSQCFAVTATAKGTRISVYGLDFKTQGPTKFIT